MQVNISGTTWKKVLSKIKFIRWFIVDEKSSLSNKNTHFLEKSCLPSSTKNSFPYISCLQRKFLFKKESIINRCLHFVFAYRSFYLCVYQNIAICSNVNECMAWQLACCWNQSANAAQKYISHVNGGDCDNKTVILIKFSLKRNLISYNMIWYFAYI